MIDIDVDYRNHFDIILSGGGSRVTLAGSEIGKVILLHRTERARKVEIFK